MPAMSRLIRCKTRLEDQMDSRSRSVAVERADNLVTQSYAFERAEPWSTTLYIAIAHRILHCKIRLT
jgi:hypothetical protein